MSQPTNATRIRPSMPDYGITSEPTEGMLTWDWVDTQMEQSRNYWICTTRPDGRPHAAPVWGVWLNNTLYFGTGKSSVKAKNVNHRNQVVVHLESGDNTLIIEGALRELLEPDKLKNMIIPAYSKKYPSYPTPDADAEEDESAIWYVLVPHKIMAWLENDFLNSAAYWLFDV